MKTIAIHSHKGGVGKTTVALLLAKYAAISLRQTCFMDFDFIGSGISDLLDLKNKPRKYVEDYFQNANPHEFEIQQLLTSYTDRGMEHHKFTVILNVGDGLPNQKKAKSLENLKADQLALVANEPHYKEIENRTVILLEKLEKHEIDLVVVDCHPGLDMVSDTMVGLADLNVYVATPNRADCFGLLKTLNLRKLDKSNALLLMNKSVSTITDVDSFGTSMKRDGLVGFYADTLMANLKFLGKKQKHLALIPESKMLREVFYLGGKGKLPEIDKTQAEFKFLDSIMSLLKPER